MKRGKKKLPPAPTGYEALDIMWADASRLAPLLLSEMPHDVSPAWSTIAAAEVVVRLRNRLETQLKEFLSTPRHSTVRVLRRRDFERLRRSFIDACWLFAAALAVKVRKEFPKASPAQVFMRVGQETRQMLTAAAGSSAQP